MNIKVRWHWEGKARNEAYDGDGVKNVVSGNSHCLCTTQQRSRCTHT